MLNNGVKAMAKLFTAFRWVLVGGLAFLAGWRLVLYLVVDPLSMSLHLVLACALGFATMLAIGFLFRRWVIPLAAVLALGLLVAGYWAMTARVLAMPDPREVPEIARSEDDPGLAHTAVVYFTHGEPSQYSPIGWINRFNEFDEQGIAFVPALVRRMATLEQACHDAGDTTTRFHLSFLDDEPRPDAAAIQAPNDGASRIILAEVFLTVSNHTAEGEEPVEALHAEKRFGVEVRRTGPPWDWILPRRTSRQTRGSRTRPTGVGTPSEKVTSDGLSSGDSLRVGEFLASRISRYDAQCTERR